ncbi:hypothetical protein [Vibrio phage vB_pir03]|nr:hypothetical protein [Vibrio phage vB_pir03]
MRASSTWRNVMIEPQPLEISLHPLTVSLYPITKW